LKVFIAGLFLLLSFTAAAIPYTPDSELMRSGRVVFQSHPAIGEYRLVLSSIKKVNNQWRAKQEVKSRALISRTTLELDELMSYTDARKKLRSDMDNTDDFAILFQCSGLDCGSSNGWANEFLGVKQLYGLDTSQFYVVQAGLDGDRKETYVIWYLVQRGNGRIYLQQDVVRAGPDSGAGSAFAPELWWELLVTKGFFVLPGIELVGDAAKVPDETVALLVSLLRDHSRVTLRIVGHDYGAGTLADRERRSLGYAQGIRDLLFDKGIDKSRVSAHGLANLAPAGRREAARVEIVLD
jgi:hypothetical protein